MGCAPDTFLGGGQQTARKLIDDGAIGKPLGGTAFVLTPGPESWHPSPEFYYQTGGGPVFDMGPYYITALINLLGPVTRVTSIARRSFAERVFGAGPRKGEKFPVEILTHFNALVEFEQGAIVSFHASFDVQGHSHLPIEIYGTDGSLQIPDPNFFGGPVRLLEKGGRWVDMPLTHGFATGTTEFSVLPIWRRQSGQIDRIEHPIKLRSTPWKSWKRLFPEASPANRLPVYSHCERPRALQPLPRFGVLD